MTANFPDPALPPLVIVDDCDDDIFLLRCRLREGGITHPIVSFGSAQEALGFFEVLRVRGAKPAYVFVEIKLPGDQGFELLARLRETPEWEEVRLIVVTPSNDPADLDRALRLHVDGYIVKFPSADLLAEFVRNGPWFAVPMRQAALAGTT
jgi:CheY-like chemotaxis protein